MDVIGRGFCWRWQENPIIRYHADFILIFKLANLITSIKGYFVLLLFYLYKSFFSLSMHRKSMWKLLVKNDNSIHEFWKSTKFCIIIVSHQPKKLNTKHKQPYFSLISACFFCFCSSNLAIMQCNNFCTSL